jgi:hypothetical protein
VPTIPDSSLNDEADKAVVSAPFTGLVDDESENIRAEHAYESLLVIDTV